jgi:phosphoribosylformylglycinamidine (FGAM) synthase PurS component
MKNDLRIQEVRRKKFIKLDIERNLKNKKNKLKDIYNLRDDSNLF